MDAEPVVGTSLFSPLRARSLRLLRRLLGAWSVNSIPGDGAWPMLDAKRVYGRAAERPYTFTSYSHWNTP
jgi:hypothetical protein